MPVKFTVNTRAFTSDAPPQTPLLWVIREQLKLTGTKFGCGAGLCGACMVHIDGKRAFSCQTQLSEVAGRAVTTIEGLSPDSSHPVQKAWLAERAPVRLLPVGPDHERRRAVEGQSQPLARTDRRAYEHQYLPLRNLSAHRARHRTRRTGGLSHARAHRPENFERFGIAPPSDDRRRGD